VGAAPAQTTVRTILLPCTGSLSFPVRYPLMRAPAFVFVPVRACHSTPPCYPRLWQSHTARCPSLLSPRIDLSPNPWGSPNDAPTPTPEAPTAPLPRATSHLRQPRQAGAAHEAPSHREAPSEHPQPSEDDAGSELGDGGAAGRGVPMSPPPTALSASEGGDADLADGDTSPPRARMSTRRHQVAETGSREPDAAKDRASPMPASSIARGEAEADDDAMSRSGELSPADTNDSGPTGGAMGSGDGEEVASSGSSPPVRLDAAALAAAAELSRHWAAAAVAPAAPVVPAAPAAPLATSLASSTSASTAQVSCRSASPAGPTAAAPVSQRPPTVPCPGAAIGPAAAPGLPVEPLGASLLQPARQTPPPLSIVPAAATMAPGRFSRPASPPARTAAAAPLAEGTRPTSSGSASRRRLPPLQMTTDGASTGAAVPSRASPAPAPLSTALVLPSPAYPSALPVTATSTPATEGRTQRTPPGSAGACAETSSRGGQRRWASAIEDDGEFRRQVASQLPPDTAAALPLETQCARAAVAAVPRPRSSAGGSSEAASDAGVERQRLAALAFAALREEGGKSPSLQRIGTPGSDAGGGSSADGADPTAAALSMALRALASARQPDGSGSPSRSGAGRAAYTIVADVEGSGAKADQEAGKQQDTSPHNNAEGDLNVSPAALISAAVAGERSRLACVFSVCHNALCGSYHRSRVGRSQ